MGYGNGKSENYKGLATLLQIITVLPTTVTADNRFAAASQCWMKTPLSVWGLSY